MHPAIMQPGAARAVVVLVIFIVGLCVAYWRMALRLLAIGLISLAVLSAILAVLGVIDALHELRHLVG